LGTEHLRLYLTKNGVIVARVGKRGAGALAGLSLLGKFSSGLEGLFGRKTLPKTKGFKGPSSEAILRADKDNFYIAYDDIVRVEIVESSSRVGFLVLTTNDKLNFQTPMRVEHVLSLLNGVLGPKVTARRR
jgi:hypothetical protein